MMRTENVQNRRHNVERGMRCSREDTGLEADTKRKHGSLMATLGIPQSWFCGRQPLPLEMLCWEFLHFKLTESQSLCLMEDRWPPPLFSLSPLPHLLCP